MFVSFWIELTFLSYQYCPFLFGSQLHFLLPLRQLLLSPTTFFSCHLQHFSWLSLLPIRCILLAVSSPCILWLQRRGLGQFWEDAGNCKVCGHLCCLNCQRATCCSWATIWPPKCYELHRWRGLKLMHWFEIANPSVVWKSLVSYNRPYLAELPLLPTLLQQPLSPVQHSFIGS